MHQPYNVFENSDEQIGHISEGSENLAEGTRVCRDAASGVLGQTPCASNDHTTAPDAKVYGRKLEGPVVDPFQRIIDPITGDVTFQPYSQDE